MEDGIRLQKILASAGIGSRRVCEGLIADGRVTVDGQVVELGARVDPATSIIHVDGTRIPIAPGIVVLALNKPRGVVTTMSDEHGRRCVGDLVTDREERLFHVGRLDADTEGLLILTNDGELANRLGHPSHEIDKEYLATVEGEITRDALRQLERGVDLEDGTAACDRIRIVSQVPGRSMVELVIHEGRNRIVRRMLDSVGFPVTDLVRTRIGPLYLAQQRSGTMRTLQGSELYALYTAVGL